MPDDIKDQLQDLLQGKDAEEAASLIKEASQPLYQHIFDKGHSTAVAAKAQEMDSLKEERDAFKGKAETLQADVKDLKANTPDLEEWRQKKEDALLQKEKEWKDRFEDLQQQYHGEKRQAIRSGLVAQLQQKGLDEWTAQRAVDDGSLSKRVKVQDGTIRFYQKDGETPLAVDSRDEAVSVLAADYYGSVPESLRTGPKQSFGGAGTGDDAKQLTDADIRSMSDEEYSKHRDAILANAAN